MTPNKTPGGRKTEHGCCHAKEGQVGVPSRLPRAWQVLSGFLVTVPVFAPSMTFSGRLCLFLCPTLLSNVDNLARYLTFLLKLLLAAWKREEFPCRFSSWQWCSGHPGLCNNMNCLCISTSLGMWKPRGLLVSDLSLMWTTCFWNPSRFQNWLYHRSCVFQDWMQSFKMVVFKLRCAPWVSLEGIYILRSSICNSDSSICGPQATSIHFLFARTVLLNDAWADPAVTQFRNRWT